VRIIPIFLTVFLIVSARCTHADEFVHGQVLSIHRNRGALAVKVLDGADDRMKTHRGSARSPNHTAARGPQYPPVTILGRHLLPDTIIVNSTDRIRGTGDSHRDPASPPPSPGRKGPDVHDPHLKHHDDTTGVRHRIEKGSRPGGKQSTPKRGTNEDNGSQGKGGHGGGHHGR
jgi:hypothetical protein